jgi:hypothetical protein
MSKEGFFRRWSRRKAQGEAAEPASTPVAAPGSMQYADDSEAVDLPPVAQTAPHPPIEPARASNSAMRKAPTLEDAALLGPDSDYSAFMTQGVDKAVQRMAMKKLFSDPHFSVMDGLDVYIDDYNRFDPLPAAMLASLDHAKSMFARFADEKGKPGGEPKDGPADEEPPEQGDA